MNILVTGGTGYIGSHTVVELIKAGHNVVIFDNLYNSKEVVLDYIEKITGTRPKFYKADMLCPEEMEPIFKENTFDAVIHFAGLKAVGESVEMPLKYYERSMEKIFMNKETKKELHAFLKMIAVFGEERTFRFIKERYLKNG